jgi:hypothetical protein
MKTESTGRIFICEFFPKSQQKNLSSPDDVLLTKLSFSDQDKTFTNSSQKCLSVLLLVMIMAKSLCRSCHIFRVFKNSVLKSTKIVERLVKCPHDFKIPFWKKSTTLYHYTDQNIGMLPLFPLWPCSCVKSQAEAPQGLIYTASCI